MNEIELQDLFVLGFIGYEYGDNSKQAHIGEEILKKNNYKYYKEIYYHGDINAEYQSFFKKF